MLRDPVVWWIFAAFVFMTGTCVASFLNVVIWRVPRGESIVSPPSHCPKCNAGIRWYWNIPVFSWLALRGRCANCGEPISPRYILIELLGGCLFLAVFAKFGSAQASLPPIVVAQMVVAWIWVSLMIVGSMIDFDHKLLPDFVTVGGMLLGLAFWLLVSLSCNDFAFEPRLRMWFPLLHSAGGLVFGFGLLWLVRFFGSIAFKREAMGLGDVFLMGAVGAIHGPMAVLFVLVFSSLFGSVIGVSMIALSKVRFGRFVEIPFGPYICMADLLYVFFGSQLIELYFAALLK